MPGVYFINFRQPKDDLEIDIQEVESGIFKGNVFDISYASLNIVPESMHFFAQQKP